MLQGVMGPLEATTIARCGRLLNKSAQDTTRTAQNVIKELAAARAPIAEHQGTCRAFSGTMRRCYARRMDRRPRMTRTRTGRRIELSTRDLALFALLTRYRYLRSTYLHAFTGGASETRFKERLGDLFHEGYLDRPTQQWEYADARCRPVVHEIGAGGVRALQDGSGATEEVTFLRGGTHRQFRHSLMVCEVLASLELGCRAAGLRFIPWPEILARAPDTTRASPTPWRLPLPSSGFLMPDGMFGIEYEAEGSKSYRFFALEADRGTMPLSRTGHGQTSYLGKLAAYRAAIEAGTHRTHWGVPNLLVLTILTEASRLAQALRHSGAGGASPALLFKTVRERDLIRPRLDLLGEPWLRMSSAPLYIGAPSNPSHQHLRQ